MILEEALVVEFDTIPEISGKVYPLYTGEGVEPPFLVYLSSEGKYDSSLNEVFTTREITVELHIVGRDYVELKTIERAVISKIISFRGRVIGIDGPMIRTMQYDPPSEVYEGETNIYRASFDMTVRI
jgi:hypothetical protein